MDVFAVLYVKGGLNKMGKIKWVSATLLALLLTVLAFPMNAIAASITPGMTDITAVTCFYAQTGENMPRRQSGASSLLANTIRDDEGKGLCMLFVEADGATISDIGVGGALTDSKIKKTNAGKPIWVYCVQHHTSANDGLNYTAQNAGANAFWAGLSETQRRALEITLLCGFPSVSSLGGVTANCDLYAATQALIWEFQYGNNRTVNTVNGKYRGTTLSSARETAYFNSTTKAAYNALVSAVNTFLTEPVITGTDYNSGTNTVTLKWSNANSRYEATVTDSQNVLGNYVTSGSSGGINWSISGNRMTLYTTDKNADNVSLSINHSVLNSSNLTDQALLILDHGTQQKMVTGINRVDPIPFKIKAVTEDAGSCKIVKVSEDGKAANVSFTVTGPGNFTTTVKTGADGTFTIANLSPGTYTVKEVMPDNSYIPTASQTVTVQSGKTASVTFSNKIKRGTFTALKIDAGTEKPIPGAVFDVYDTSDNKVASAETDENGVAVFENLPYGEYYAIESTAPDGYILSDKRFEFSITEDGQAVEETFEDENLMRNFSVYKKGEVLTGFTESKDGDRTVFTPTYEEQYLSGCVVGIYAGEDVYTADGTKRFEKDELVDSVVTAKDGPAFTKDLFEGLYYAKEIAAPKGYALSEEKTEVSLFEDDMSVTFENERIKCNLTFMKLMSDTMPELLPTLYEQVVFGVFAGEDIEGLPAGSLLEIIRPDRYGSCRMTADLPYGFKYYVKELETASGYVNDENEYSFDFMPAASDPVCEIEICENNEIINRPDESKRAIERAYYGPDTSDELSENVRLLIITAIESIVLTVLIIIKKNKLTLYY